MVLILGINDIVYNIRTLTVEFNRNLRRLEVNV